MTIPNLRALHTIIGEAIDEIDRVYKDHSSMTTPLDYPSLDAPYYNNQKHTPDVNLAEELRISPTVFAAANRIVAACGQITATVHRPFFYLVDGMNGGNLVGCLAFFEATNISEILREAGPAGLNVKNIASKIADLRPGQPEIDPSKISHVLRLLATHHWVREVTPDVFTNNRLSSFIDSGKSTEQLKAAPEKKHDETDGVAAYVGLATDEVNKSQSVLSDWLLSGGGSPGGSTNGYRSPFNQVFKTQLNFFEWLEQPGNESRLTRFGNAMNSLGYWEGAEDIIHGFPWQKLPKDSVVVDVAGGIGAVSVVVAEAYPCLRFVVEDRTPVVAIAPQSWGVKHAEVFSSGHVSFHAQDFFEPRRSFDVPGVGTIFEPDVFLLRAVAHNWPDTDVIKILKSLHAAAASHTRLFLADIMLPYACLDKSVNTSLNLIDGSSKGPGALVPEDSPLLPNLGRASANGYILDISMLGMFDAKERTFHEFDALLQAAGWNILTVERAVGSLWAYITACPSNTQPCRVPIHRG